MAGRADADDDSGCETIKEARHIHYYNAWDILALAAEIQLPNKHRYDLSRFPANMFRAVHR